MKHYIVQKTSKSDKVSRKVSRLVIMKALDRSGLVKQKVNVKTPRGVIQAYRWLRPGETPQQGGEGAQATPQAQQPQAPVVNLNLIRKRSSTKVGSFINHGGQELKVTAVGQHGVTARDGKGNKFQVAWDHVFRGGAEPKVAETQEPYVEKKSVPEEEREKKFNESNKEQRIASATWDDTSRTMDADLSETRFTEATHAKMKGDSVGDNVSHIKKNAMAELKSMANYLAGDTALLAGSMVQRVSDILEKHKDEFKDAKAEDMDALVTDFVRKVMFQEIESNRHQFTDHGIRHIVNNIDTQQRILDVLGSHGEKITGRDRLLGIFTMVNHDVGYTHPLVRDGSIKASHEHKEYGEKVAKEQKGTWDEGKVFTPEEYDRATDYIRTHDAGDMEYKGKFDPVAASTRLADNLSLFASEKLPSVFKYVNGGQNLLTQMGRSAGDKDYEKFDELRGKLYKQIDGQDNIGKNLKRDLKAATADLNYLTPKFSMRALAGEITDINHGGDQSAVNIKIKHNDFDVFLQNHFDMGQKALRGFLEDNGIKPPYDKKSYEIGKYKGKSLLRIEVER